MFEMKFDHLLHNPPLRLDWRFTQSLSVHGRHLHAVSSRICPTVHVTSQSHTHCLRQEHTLLSQQVPNGHSSILGQEYSQQSSIIFGLEQTTSLQFFLHSQEQKDRYEKFPSRWAHKYKSLGWVSILFLCKFLKFKLYISVRITIKVTFNFEYNKLFKTNI